MTALMISEWFSVTVRVRVRPSESVYLGALGLLATEGLDGQPHRCCPFSVICPKPAVVRPYLAISVSSRPISFQSDGRRNRIRPEAV